MKLTSLDGSMTLALAVPGMGFALTLNGHVWLFDRDGRITASIPPFITPEQIAGVVEGHLNVSSPERCPGCKAFVQRNSPER